MTGCLGLDFRLGITQGTVGMGIGHGNLAPEEVIQRKLHSLRKNKEQEKADGFGEGECDSQ